MRKLNFVLLMLLAFPMLSIAAEDNKMKEDNQHIRTWNAFADNVLKLHHKLINKHRHKMEKSSGGYAENKEFYIEENYISEKTGKLLSKVQWEKDNPDVMHTIEVYVHNDKGQIARDFMAAYLPGYHNAPVQTLISFHQYKDKLHGFRTFDATGDRVLERCEGEYKGEPFEFILDEDELYEAEMSGNPIDKKMYALCIGELPTKLGKYITPQ